MRFKVKSTSRNSIWCASKNRGDYRNRESSVKFVTRSSGAVQKEISALLTWNYDTTFRVYNVYSWLSLLSFALCFKFPSSSKGRRFHCRSRCLLENTEIKFWNTELSSFFLSYSAVWHTAWILLAGFKLASRKNSPRDLCYRILIFDRSTKLTYHTMCERQMYESK